MSHYSVVHIAATLDSVRHPIYLFPTYLVLVEVEEDEDWIERIPRMLYIVSGFGQPSAINTPEGVKIGFRSTAAKARGVCWFVYEVLTLDPPLDEALLYWEEHGSWVGFTPSVEVDEEFWRQTHAMVTPAWEGGQVKVVRMNDALLNHLDDSPEHDVKDVITRFTRLREMQTE